MVISLNSIMEQKEEAILGNQVLKQLSTLSEDIKYITWLLPWCNMSLFFNFWKP